MAGDGSPVAMFIHKMVSILFLYPLPLSLKSKILWSSFDFRILYFASYFVFYISLPLVSYISFHFCISFCSQNCHCTPCCWAWKARFYTEFVGHFKESHYSRKKNSSHSGASWSWSCPWLGRHQRGWRPSWCPGSHDQHSHHRHASTKPKSTLADNHSPWF